MKSGDVTSASLAVGQHLRYLFYEGEKLPSLREKHELYLKQTAKYNIEAAKRAILDKLSIDLLMGLPCDSFSIFDGMIPNENTLLADALQKNNTHVMISIYARRFLSSFWLDEYTEARKWARLALSNTKQLGPFIVKTLLFNAQGVIAFQMYRDGEGEKYFEEGEKMLKELEKWLGISERHFKNRYLLLRAEYYASTCQVKMAKQAYKESIQSSRNYGRIQDQALGNELLGRFLSSIVEVDEATECFRNAYNLYMLWGAVAKAKHLQEKHRLDLSDGWSKEVNPTKHRRVR
jgi:tetratricopeptide (TPR) repeat protein